MYITIAALIIIIVLVFIPFGKKKLKKKIVEDYTLLPSESEKTWFLGRRMNWDVEHPDHPDSKPFLESLGFRIRGKADEKRYAVEPPEGWNIIRYGERLHSYVADKNGNPKFWIFEKREIYEFKAYIYESEKMNAVIIKTLEENA